MTLAAVAALALLAAAPDSECPRGRCQRSRGGRAVANAASAPFVLASSYNFAAPDALPACNVGNSCVALCSINTGGTAWQCVDASGASFGTATTGAGATFQPATFGRLAQTDVTAANYSYVVSTTLDALFKGDHTVVIGAYGTGATLPTHQHWFGASDGTRSVYYRGEGGNFVAVENEGAAVNTSTAGLQPTDGWSVASVRRSGTTSTTRVNGVDGTPVAAAAITNNFTAGTQFRFGERNPTGLPLRGPLAFVAFYSAALSSASLKAMEFGFWGVDSASSVAGLGTGVQCLSPDGGSVDCYQIGASMVSSVGFRHVWGAVSTNRMAASPLDVSSWTDVGTPTITTNVSAGPFYRWKQTNECDLVVDDDGAAFEGKRGPGNAFYRNSAYLTGSFWLAAGTSGTERTKARIIVSTDGTPATTTCDVTGLTSVPAVYSCPTSATLAGASTASVEVLVGNATTDTGSIVVCQGQSTAAKYVSIPQPVNTTLGNSALRLDASGWPYSSTTQGKYEVVFTPVYDPLNDWSGDTLYLFDGATSVPGHSALMLFGYTVAGRGLARLSDGTTTTDIQVDGVGLTAYQQYVTSLEWRKSGSTCDAVWRLDTCSDATTCTASTTLGTSSAGACPAALSTAYLGNRYDNTVPTDVFVRAVRVYGP